MSDKLVCAELNGPVGSSVFLTKYLHVGATKHEKNNEKLVCEKCTALIKKLNKKFSGGFAFYLFNAHEL